MKPYRQLSTSERKLLMLGATEGMSRRAMARWLGRAPSTISRELLRNAGGRTAGRYDAALADALTRKRQRLGRSKFGQNPTLWNLVQTELKAGWSPQQIAGRLKLVDSANSRSLVSHQTIYAAIHGLPRGELRAGLVSSKNQGGVLRLRFESTMKPRRGCVGKSMERRP